MPLQASPPGLLPPGPGRAAAAPAVASGKNTADPGHDLRLVPGGPGGQVPPPGVIWSWSRRFPNRHPPLPRRTCRPRSLRSSRGRGTGGADGRRRPAVIVAVIGERDFILGQGGRRRPRLCLRHRRPPRHGRRGVRRQVSGSSAALPPGPSPASRSPGCSRRRRLLQHHGNGILLVTTDGELLIQGPWLRETHLRSAAARLPLRGRSRAASDRALSCSSRVSREVSGSLAAPHSRDSRDA